MTQVWKPIRLLAALTLLSAAPALAGINHWTSQGPFGGSVKDLVSDPSFPDIIYAGVDGEGVFLTDDGGINWVDFNNTGDPGELGELKVQALAIGSLPTRYLYAGTFGGGVYRKELDNPAAGWTQVNGTAPDDLENLFVLSLVIDPQDSSVLYAGTNGGGVFRTVDGGAIWEEKNFGLGNRVVFDLKIPNPVGPIVINEVDAFMPGNGEEFIELIGPPGLSLTGMVLVLFDAVADPLSCPITNRPAVDAWDLDGEVLDEIGYFVIGDPAVPGVDFPVAGFDLPDDIAGLGLFFGSFDDFIPGGTATTNDQLDAMVYDISGGDDICLLPELGIVDQPQVNENGLGQAAIHANARVPDGGPARLTSRYVPQLPTPGGRNRRIELFAATDLNGVYRSPTEGDIWVPLTNGLPTNVVFSLAIDPVDPDPSCALSSFTAYVGTSGQGVYRSTDPCDLDNQMDWEPCDAALATETVLSMAIAPTSDNPTSGFKSFVYAGTELGQIFRSSDFCDGFSTADNGLGGLEVEALAVDILAPSLDPFRPSTAYSGTFGGGVFKTIDSGGNWFLTSFDFFDLIGVFAESVAVNPMDPSILYAGTFGGGVFRSDDGGLTWMPSNGMGVGEIGSRFVYSVALDHLDPDIVYAGTDLAGLFKSLDGGASWTAMNGVPPNDLNDQSVLDVVVDPIDPTTLYAVTGDVFKSTNGAMTWTPVNAGFGDAFVVDLAIDPIDTDRLFAGTQDDGVFKSLLGGTDTWLKFNVGLTDLFVRALAIDPMAPDIVYAGTDGGGAFKTLNAGGLWSSVSQGLTDNVVLSLAIDPFNTSLLYAGTEGDGVFRSRDGATNWSAFNVGLSNKFVLDLQIDPMDSNIVYAGTDGGGVFDINQIERIDVEPTVGLETSEFGGQATFEVSLTSIPTSNVTINLESSDPSEGTVSPSTLLFTSSASALDPKTVTVTGVDDVELDGDIAYLITTLPAISEDPDFSGIDADDVSVLNIDLGDTGVASITVNPTMGLVTSEAGQMASFEVGLDTVPTATVTIALSVSDSTEGSVSPALLELDNTTPAIVTVSGGPDDGVIDGDIPYTIMVGTASSADPAYNGVNPPDVSAVNVDLGATSIFETATLGTIGQPATSGFFVNNLTFLGAKFTVGEEFRITSLGGHLAGVAADPSVFAAIVPINAGTGFPNDFQLSDAVFTQVFDAPNPSNQVTILPDPLVPILPGTYALVFGSGLFGATGAARMPGNDVDTGTPLYFFSDNPQAMWFNGGVDDARFFINGIPASSLIFFADGFESGNTSAWSLSTIP